MSDREMTEFLKGVAGVCEATRCEQSHIWERWHERLEWKDNPMGYGETVGHLADMPVHISLTTAVIGGRKILFWHATSQVVDHRMIDKWLNENLPVTAFRDGDPRKGIFRTDATNFHIIAPSTKKAA